MWKAATEAVRLVNPLTLLRFVLPLRDVPGRRDDGGRLSARSRAAVRGAGAGGRRLLHADGAADPAIGSASGSRAPRPAQDLAGAGGVGHPR